MILFQQDITDCVLLKWHSTGELKEQGCYGLKDALIRSGILKTKELIIDLPSSGYQVIGYVGEAEPDAVGYKSYRDSWQITGQVNSKTLPYFIHDFFRQGYIGAAFYVVDYNA